MSVAETFLHTANNPKYAHLKNVYRSSQLALCLEEAQSWFYGQLTLSKAASGQSKVLNKQRYDIYQANLSKLLEKKAEDSIAWKHPRDCVKGEARATMAKIELAGIDDAHNLDRHYLAPSAGTIEGNFCPLDYDQKDCQFVLRVSEKVPDFALVKESAIKIPSLAPLSLSSRLSFELPKQYYAPPNLVAPKITSLHYEFMTESQWRNLKPYWSQLLKALTEKLTGDKQIGLKENNHFLAYALTATFPGTNFGFNEDTIEMHLQVNKNFVCLPCETELIKGDILIARGANLAHSAIYFGGDSVMASLGPDKNRPCYMHLPEFVKHPQLSQYKIYRFCA
jgi:hypothetical protein